jgi:hypothetical protein
LDELVKIERFVAAIRTENEINQEVIKDRTDDESG